MTRCLVSADIRMLLGKEIKKIVGPEEFQAAKDRGEPIGRTEKQVEGLEGHARKGRAVVVHGAPRCGAMHWAPRGIGRRDHGGSLASSRLRAAISASLRAMPAFIPATRSRYFL